MRSVADSAPDHPPHRPEPNHKRYRHDGFPTVCRIEALLLAAEHFVSSK